MEFVLIGSFAFGYCAFALYRHIAFRSNRSDWGTVKWHAGIARVRLDWIGAEVSASGFLMRAQHALPRIGDAVVLKPSRGSAVRANVTQIEDEVLKLKLV